MSLGIQSQLIETATAKLKVGNKRKRKFEDLWELFFFLKKEKQEKQINVIKIKVKFKRLHTCYVVLS